MDLARTLGIRPGARLAIINPPVRFADDLAPLPPDVAQLSLDDPALDCIVLFVKSRAELTGLLGRAARALAAAGSLWVSWPKQLSGYSTDISAEAVQAAGMGTGLLDSRRMSLNEGWTAMRFIVRLDDRAAWSKRSFDE